MSGPSLPWFRRPFRLALFAIGALFGAWFLYFGWLVAQSVVLLKSGQNPQDVARQKQFQASIARTIKTTTVTAADLKRIEPSGEEPTLGNPSASVRIVEFLDYQCPFCREEAPTIRAFMAKHASDAFLILRDFPIADLHPDAERVAVAARCVFLQGDADRFWKFHDRLFASQEQQAAGDLRLYAQQLGVDLTRFDSCVASQEPLTHIQSSFADGTAAGVEGTPTFFFNGVKIQGAIDADSLETIFTETAKRL